MDPDFERDATIVRGSRTAAIDQPPLQSSAVKECALRRRGSIGRWYRRRLGIDEPRFVDGRVASSFVTFALSRSIPRYRRDLGAISPDTTLPHLSVGASSAPSVRRVRLFFCAERGSAFIQVFRRSSGRQSQ
jgi:hypothetical protein